jgi:hypothetical protein
MGLLLLFTKYCCLIYQFSINLLLLLILCYHRVLLNMALNIPLHARIFVLVMDHLFVLQSSKLFIYRLWLENLAGTDFNLLIIHLF